MKRFEVPRKMYLEFDKCFEVFLAMFVKTHIAANELPIYYNIVPTQIDKYSRRIS